MSRIDGIIPVLCRSVKQKRRWTWALGHLGIRSFRRFGHLGIRLPGHSAFGLLHFFLR